MGYYDDLDAEIDQEMGWAKDKGKGGKDSVRRKPGYWQAILHTAEVASPLWHAIRNVLYAIARVVFYPVISPLGYSRRLNQNGDTVIVKRSILLRFVEGILTRLLLTPLILAIFLIAVVYATTHPTPLRAAQTPEGFGIYFKRVSLVTVDNQRLTGWYIPAISADQIAFDPDGALLDKWPGVVVAHGLGDTHDQYLPLAQSLHAAGFAVLMLDTRGQGESDPAAVTYGLRERMDILAGVKFLQETPYVDESKICVVGHDINAIAALQAAAFDSSITAAVADGLWLNFEDRAREVFTHPSAHGHVLPTGWLGPLYTITFEISIRDRLAQLDPESVVRNIRKQPIFFVVHAGADYAPIQDVMGLANSTTGRHEVVIANEKVDGDTERRITEFLVNATGWKGPNAHGLDQIRGMLKNRVNN